MSIPNLLSIVRILLIPAFLGVYLGAQDQPAFLIAAGILLLSGLTDLLDGYIARKYHMITQLGKILDPLADKLTQASVCIALALRMPQVVFLLVLFILKELLMLCGGIFLIRKKVVIAPSKWYGKVYTFLFYAAMLSIIGIPIVDATVVFWLLAGVALFMLFTFVMYIPVFINLKNNGRHGVNLSREREK